MVEGGGAEMPAMQKENTVMELQCSTVRLTHNPGMQIALARISDGRPKHHKYKKYISCRTTSASVFEDQFDLHVDDF